MCGPATALGVAQGVTQGMSAIGNFQQGRAQTDATNRARLNQYRDAQMMNQYRYQQELAVYRAAQNDYQAGLRESDLALGEARTALDKQGAERIAGARFESLSRGTNLLKAEGELMAKMQSGRSRDRAIAITRGMAGQDEALMMDNLLRARFSDIDKYRGIADEATSYRRKLFSAVPLAPTLAPMPSAPIMQSGPSALSLLSGLGSATMSGFTTGLSSAQALGRVGGVPKPETPKPKPEQS